MKRGKKSDELLLHWLNNALDNELFRGLKWVDKNAKIFCVSWVHKSAETWSEDVTEAYKAWANRKGNSGKTLKDLKASFRMALNSKDELKLVKKTKKERHWQIITGPAKEKGTTIIKKKPGRRASLKNKSATCGTKTHVNAAEDMLTTLTNANDKRGSDQLPPFESFGCKISSTPPHQASTFTGKIPEQGWSSSTDDWGRLTPPIEFPLTDTQNINLQSMFFDLPQSEPTASYTNSTSVASANFYCDTNNLIPQQHSLVPLSPVENRFPLSLFDEDIFLNAVPQERELTSNLFTFETTDFPSAVQESETISRQSPLNFYSETDRYVPQLKSAENTPADSLSSKTETSSFPLAFQELCRLVVSAESDSSYIMEEQFY